MTRKKRNPRNDRNDYDSAWKRALTAQLAHCLAFFFPHVHAAIDWTRKVEFLDNALRAIIGGRKSRNRQADKLVKVFLKNGESRWLLIHIEIQGQYDKDFTTRMWTYYYRAFDRYGVDVVSLAILADDNPNWRPERYLREHLGCEASLKFPIVKLWDYRDKWAELEQSTNPFAFVVMAFLKTQDTKKDAERRFRFKLELTENLHRKDFSPESIAAIYCIIDNFMALPDNLDKKFDRELTRIEEEKEMPFISGLDRVLLKRARKHYVGLGKRKGKIEGRLEGKIEGKLEGQLEGRIENARESILEVLRKRFGALPETIVDSVNKIAELDELKSMLTRAVTIRSLSEIWLK